MQGRFELRADCLVFTSDADVFRAVLPSGSRLLPPATLVIGDATTIALNSLVTVNGGEGEGKSWRARLDSNQRPQD